jgi:hypothetical protein
MTCTRSSGLAAYLLVVLTILPFAAFAQQTNLIERLKAQYETHRQRIDGEALAAYSNVLVAVGKQLQQKADVPGYLVLKSEQTFLVKKQALPEGEDRTNLVSKLPALDAPLSRIETDRNTKMANLLKQYIPALEAQIRQFMTADKLDEAKAAGEVKSSAELTLADLQAKLSRTQLAAKPSQPVPPVATDPMSAKPSIAEGTGIKPDAGKGGRKPVPKEAVAWRGHHYLYVDKAIKWQDAKEACEDMGGHLAVFETYPERAFAMKELIGRFRVWVGAYREGVKWKWVNGRAVDTDGHSLYDQVTGGAAAEVLGDVDGKLHNLRADDARPYLCEWDY